MKSKNSKKYGIILGTLGRQGSTKILKVKSTFNLTFSKKKRIEEILKKNNKDYIIVLLSEIFPKKLDLFKDIDW